MSIVHPNEEMIPPAGTYTPGPEIPRPDTSLLITDDGAPVDNWFVEKQQRLLVEPLYGSWKPSDGRPFRAYCNVGLFHAYKEPPNVPDAMLVLGVESAGENVLESDNRSYFLWVIGKPPDVVIEVVSDTRGGEDTRKLKHYASIGVIYYVIFDPELVLKKGLLRAFVLNEGEYQPTDPSKLKLVSLGFKLWDGEYENVQARWLRWVDEKGMIIPSAKERGDVAIQLADVANQRADVAVHRAEEESQRADREQVRAEEERARANAAEAKARELEEKLRKLGGTP
ncbi:MAG: Uma2 family endonuclease [Gemmataceae bacterium]